MTAMAAVARSPLRYARVGAVAVAAWAAFAHSSIRPLATASSRAPASARSEDVGKVGGWRISSGRALLSSASRVDAGHARAATNPPRVPFRSQPPFQWAQDASSAPRCRDQQNLDASLSRHTLAVRATPHQAWQTKRVEGTGRVAALVRYFKARAVGVHTQIRASLSARLSC